MDVVARVQEEIAASKELDAMAEEILAFVARIDRCEYELLTRLRAFDARQGWVGHATSCARWLTWWTGLSMQASRERVRVARALGGLPRIDEAMGRGQLSYSKVRALTRVATPQTELKWIETARRMPADHLEFLCRERGHRRNVALRKRVDRRFVRRRDTPHGMVRIEIQLPPAEADVVWEAITAATARAGAMSPADVPEAADDGASACASAEASSEVTPAIEDGPLGTPTCGEPEVAPAEAGAGAMDFAAQQRRLAEEALREVRAELKAAEEARKPRRQPHSPANDAPDLEEVRADAILSVAESFIRFEREPWRSGRPRPP